MRSIPLRLWAFSILSAALQLLPFPLAGPVPLWRRIFCWFCLVPLLKALLSNDRSGSPLRPLQTALLGYACGVCWYAGNCYWIYQTMHIYGNLPKSASLGILILFSLYLGLYDALFGWMVGTIRSHYSVRTAVWIAPVAWVAVELARARITGFPWDLLGYTQVDDLALTRLAPWTGVMGISLLIAAVNALWLVRISTRRRPWKLIPPGLALAVVLLTTGLTLSQRNRLQAAPATSVATLLQENLSVGSDTPSDRETKAEMLSAFTYLTFHPLIESNRRGSQPVYIPAGSVSPAVKPRLIVWPEAPTSFVDSDPSFRQAIGALALRAAAPVIVNDVSFASVNPDGRYNLYNSASFFYPDGSYAGRYDKMHLVPFGEYTPYKPLFFFAGHLLDDLPFLPGVHRNLLTSQGARYGVFICYESIFGDEIRQTVKDGAQVLVNISDDGWYGDTSAPFEHIDMVRMRAIENRRWVLRSTNTGITAAIDPQGRITATLPRHVRSSLDVFFSYRNDETFYTVHGDWLAWICGVVTAGLCAAGYARRSALKVS
jgi:apolipoprotein N-acyltransferase